MEIRKEYLQILIYINLFCGFTSRKLVFARGARLNCEVRLTPRSSPVPDTLELRKLLTFAGMLLGFNAILKISAV